MTIIAKKEGTVYAKNKEKAKEKALHEAEKSKPFDNNEGLKAALKKSSITVEPVTTYKYIKKYKEKGRDFGWDYVAVVGRTY